MKVRYTVILAPDPETGAIGVAVPMLPGCVTVGETIEEALANAREAIATHVEGLAAYGDEVPVEPDGLMVVAVDAEINALVPA